MALRPPARGGSSGSTGRGISRRRRPSELLIAQTFGGAAGDVLADITFSSTAANNDKTGTVAGTTTLSGTVTGSKGASGATAGSIAYTGTVTGSEGSPGGVVGEIAYAGTVAGSKAATGATAAQIAYTGTVVGTKYDPDAPVEPTVPTGGRSRPGWYRPYLQPAKPAPEVEAKSGRVRGSVSFSGTAAGRKRSAGRAAGLAVTYRAAVAGHKSGHAVVLGRTHSRATVVGTGITTVTTADLRRMRDDAELLLII